jgi:hypothetical protein
MNTKFLPMILIIALLFTGCAPSPEAIQKAIEETQKAAPTPTTKVTEIPSYNFQSLLIQEGDLPSGYTPSQIRQHGSAPEIFETENLEEMITQELTYNDQLGGYVSLYLYDSSDSAKTIYESYLAALPVVVLIRIGKLGDNGAGNREAIKTKDGFIMSQYSSVIFQRCKVVFVADLVTEKSYSGLIDYARRLDERLNDVVCN